MKPTESLIYWAEELVDAVDHPISTNVSHAQKNLRAAISSAKAAEEGVGAAETEWGRYQQVLRYEARKVLDPANDPDCVAAWRNGHGGIDYEHREARGQIPIFSLRCRPVEIEAGDWLVRWEGQTNWCWVETDDRVRKMFELPALF